MVASSGITVTSDFVKDSSAHLEFNNMREAEGQTVRETDMTSPVCTYLMHILQRAHEILNTKSVSYDETHWEHYGIPSISKNSHSAPPPNLASR